MSEEKTKKITRLFTSYFLFPVLFFSCLNATCWAASSTKLQRSRYAHFLLSVSQYGATLKNDAKLLWRFVRGEKLDEKETVRKNRIAQWLKIGLGTAGFAVAARYSAQKYYDDY